MKRESAGSILSTVFVDYDNIYLSLKRKNDDAAKRFAKESGTWLQALISGELITPTSPFAFQGERRIVLNRCYGNSQPRRNPHDNSTDMNSFPFVRHHFMRAGFETIDCPPTTAQLKNSADIRIVMDIRDLIEHNTHFDEFIIMSGDADFTPVLHRLRAHARSTVVFASDNTAQPYTALSDSEVRESHLMELLLSGRRPAIETETREALAAPAAPQLTAADLEAARTAILTEVINVVRTAPQAVPLETLADRAVRVIGRDKTVGTNWGGYGTFRELLLADLPDDLHVSDTAPYTVFDGNRHITAAGLVAPQLSAPEAAPQNKAAAPAEAPRSFQPAPAPRYAQRPLGAAPDAAAPSRRIPDPQPVLTPQAPPMPTRQEAPQRSYAAPAASQPAAAPSHAAPSHAAHQPAAHAPAAHVPSAQAPAAPAQRAPVAPPRREAPRQPQASVPQATAPRTADQATQIQQSIARIHEACQAPALAPAEYRVLFDVMAQEIAANGLQGSQTLANITQRAREFGLDLKRDDLRFILEVVSESDPWFEQGASANLFASRFRNFVVARCRSHGLSLSADELDLVEAWFSAQPAQQRVPAYGRAPQQPQQQPAGHPQGPAAPQDERWWSLEEGRQHIAEQRAQDTYGAAEQEEEFPRIVRTRLRG